MEILKENPEKIDWYLLSRNSNAISILENNKEKIDWYSLSYNKNAIKLLLENPEKIHYDELSYNSNAIELIEKNKEKIDWYNLSINPSIFTYDYDKIRKDFEELGEEIIAKALHPKRIFRLIEEYGEDQKKNF